MEQALEVLREELPDQIIVTVTVIGEVDASTDSLLLAALAPDSGRPFVIDLARTTFMDSTGVRALLKAQQQGVTIASVRNIPPNVRRVVDVLGLGAVLPLAEAESA